MHSLLLVEDDATLGTAVARAISTRRGWQVRVVGTGAAALAAAGSETFALAIVDLGLPDIEGTHIIEQLARRSPPVRAVAFTIFDDRATVLGAVNAGAIGYLLKEEPVDRVVAQLEECLDGHMPISSRVARYLFELGRAAPSSVALTEREEDVLGCLVRGATYEECASALGVRLATVQTHVKNLYRKLDVTTKAEAAAWATRHLRS